MSEFYLTQEQFSAILEASTLTQILHELDLEKKEMSETMKTLQDLSQKTRLKRSLNSVETLELHVTSKLDEHRKVVCGDT